MPLRRSLIALLPLAIACSGDEGFDTNVSPDLAAEAPALFSENCAICHGDTGLGSDFGPDLNERVPGLAPLDIASIITVGQGTMRPVDEVTNDEAVAISFYVVDTWGGSAE